MKESGKIKLAFFDIDGTISKRPLPEHGIKVLGELPFRTGEVFDGFDERTKLRLDSNSLKSLQKTYRETQSDVDFGEYAGFAARYFMSLLRRYSLDEVREVCRKAVDRALYYQFSKDLIEALRSQGYIFVAISGSPQFLVDAFVEKFGFDHGIGRNYQLNPKTLTYDECGAETFHQKHLIIEDFLKDKFPDNDRDNFEIVAVGDTEGDFEMLAMADRAFAINPSQGLTEKIDKIPPNHMLYLVYTSKNTAAVIDYTENSRYYGDGSGIVEADGVVILSNSEVAKKYLTDVISKTATELLHLKFSRMGWDAIHRFEKENSWPESP